MKALDQPERFIAKFVKLIADDIRARQGVDQTSIGQYSDQTALIGLFEPQTKKAEKMLVRSLKAI
jgi:hypothetical protein